MYTSLTSTSWLLPLLYWTAGCSGGFRLLDGGDMRDVWLGGPVRMFFGGLGCMVVCLDGASLGLGCLCGAGDG